MYLERLPTVVYEIETLTYTYDNKYNISLTTYFATIYTDIAPWFIDRSQTYPFTFIYFLFIVISLIMGHVDLLQTMYVLCVVEK